MASFHDGGVEPTVVEWSAAGVEGKLSNYLASTVVERRLDAALAARAFSWAANCLGPGSRRTTVQSSFSHDRVAVALVS